MHADYRRGLNAFTPLDGLEMNHRDSGMRVAFCTGGHTGVATNTPARVNVKLPLAQALVPPTGGRTMFGINPLRRLWMLT